MNRPGRAATEGQGVCGLGAGCKRLFSYIDPTAELYDRLLPAAPELPTANAIVCFGAAANLNHRFRNNRFARRHSHRGPKRKGPPMLVLNAPLAEMPFFVLASDPKTVLATKTLTPGRHPGNLVLNTLMASTPPPESHISLDQEAEAIQHFFRTLPVGAAGSVIDLDGKALVRLLPVTPGEGADEAKIRTAIRNRRDDSRTLNQAWGAADAETWA